MYKLSRDNIREFSGEVVMFRYCDWDFPVKAKIINKPGRYESYRGREFSIADYECPAAVYLEEPEDGCAYCGEIDDDYYGDKCEVFLISINKGRG